MEIDLGNGVKRKDFEGLKKRNALIMRTILGLSILLFVLKSTFFPSISWIMVFAPIWFGAVLFFMLLAAAALIMRFARDF